MKQFNFLLLLYSVQHEDLIATSAAAVVELKHVDFDLLITQMNRKWAKERKIPPTPGFKLQATKCLVKHQTQSPPYLVNSLFLGTQNRIHLPYMVHVICCMSANL